MDRSAGALARVKALCCIDSKVEIEEMMMAMCLTVEDVALSLRHFWPGARTLVRQLAQRAIPRDFANKVVSVWWKIDAGQSQEAFFEALLHIQVSHFSEVDERMADCAVEAARNLCKNDGINQYFLRLTDAVAGQLRQGALANWFVHFASVAVENSELSADVVADAAVAVLNETSRKLDRPDRRHLFDLLIQIDGAAVYRCLDTYLDLCPAVGSAAEQHLGSGGWYCYLAGDYARFLELTDRALEFAPQADWLLCNRAFALHLLGHPGPEVMALYAQAQAVTPDQDRWIKAAVEDLEKHPERRPGANPIATDFIAAVTALGQSLPPAPRPDESLAPTPLPTTLVDC
ncbi:hypothetical protein [Azospirillum canadense]|uniref:hypothetical protein n=1 Tax=Azospirillum canadense TaxID=403962 RepID=UPI002228063F|nr:hypothetical protein [Azospirillum canadense]MCW2236019.1 tetratricopeptide (TPR) repeat protein [Azospirillum canadense]